MPTCLLVVIDFQETDTREDDIFLHLRLHLFLNREGCWGTTDDFTTNFSHFALVSTSLWDLANSRPVHPLILSSHLFFFSVCLVFFPFHCVLQDGLVRPDERETCAYHFSLHFFTIIRSSSCGPTACWILAQTSSLITWSLYEIRSILR